MPFARFPHFERYIAPARDRSQVWRLIVGLVLFLAVYALLATVYMMSVGGVLGLRDAVQTVGTTEGLATPLGALLMLGSFICMAIAIALVTRFLHKRPISTLLGRADVVLRDFLRIAGAYILIAGAITAVWILVSRPLSNLEIGVWLTLLPLSLAGIAIQTLAEELVFRGYMQQQLAARFKSPLVWMGIPALLFGLAHFDPSINVMTALSVVGVITVFGLVAADLTARTGSIGAAWGFHFANNLFALTILGLDGSITGLALFRTPYSVDDVDLPIWLFGIDAIAIIATWLICLRILSMRRGI